jgi:hypothetical protein
MDVADPAGRGPDAIPKLNFVEDAAQQLLCRASIGSGATRATEQSAYNSGRGLRVQADAANRQKRCWEKSGTGIERQPDAERFLTRGAFRPFQLLGNFRRGGLLFRQRLQFSNLGRRPGAPLL